MSQNKFSNKIPSTLRELLRTAAKPLFFILFLIMVCSFLAHYLTGSETLEEYARANPDIAYGNSDTAADKALDMTPDPTAADTVSGIAPNSAAAAGTQDSASDSVAAAGTQNSASDSAAAA